MTVELMSRTEYWAVDIEEDDKSSYAGNSYTITIIDDENTGSSDVEVFNTETDEIVKGDEEDAILEYLEKHKGEK